MAPVKRRSTRHAPAQGAAEARPGRAPTPGVAPARTPGFPRPPRIPAPPPGRLRPEGVALAYARDREGRVTPVAALDALTRRSRAPFNCPGCGDELVARLGAQRARHFAHRPGSDCPLTSPETALHYNAKERLLWLCRQAFQGELGVTLLVRCATCRRLDQRDLAALGDAAATEGAVGTLRADVLVTRAGRPALALEVLVTHAVDACKEAALAAAGVPAVEVDARAGWEREVAGGVEVACLRSLGFPPCPGCRAEVRAETDRALGGEAAQIAELEAYRARGLLGRLAGLTELTGPAGRSGGHAGHDALMTRRRRKTAGRPGQAREAGRVKPPGSRMNSLPDQESSSHDSGSGVDGGPIAAAERDALTARFRCPDCGQATLAFGARLATHPCPGQGSRPVAWRGYDGGLAVLGWWRPKT